MLWSLQQVGAKGIQKCILVEVDANMVHACRDSLTFCIHVYAAVATAVSDIHDNHDDDDDDDDDIDADDYDHEHINK